MIGADTPADRAGTVELVALLVLLAGLVVFHSARPLAVAGWCLGFALAAWAAESRVVRSAAGHNSLVDWLTAAAGALAWWFIIHAIVWLIRRRRRTFELASL